MPLGIDELIGALPDAIAWALFQAGKMVAERSLQRLVDYGFNPLLTIVNPLDSPEAMTAYTDIRNVAIAMLPLLLAGSFIVWPFTQEERDVSLWQLVLRLVGILIFIGLSKPLWGFAVDATNALTVALAPDSFQMTFNEDALGIGGVLADLFFYPIAAFMLFFSLLASVGMLVLRWFVVWFAFLGTPLFAVLLYPKWGPLSSIGKYGGTLLRMGVYALLAGPVVALVLRVFSVIMGGGLINSNTDIGGTILHLGVTLAFFIILPFLLWMVIYKVISWAGQPLGIGQAFTAVTAAVAAIVGTAVGGPAGGAAGGAAGAGGGGGAAGGSAAAGGAGGASGGGGAAGGSTAGGGASGASGAATDPSAGTGESMVDAGVDNSIDEETWEAADEAVEEELDVGGVHGAAQSARQRVAGAKNTLRKGAKTIGGKAKPAGLSDRVNKVRNKVTAALDNADQAADNDKLLQQVGFEPDEGTDVGDVGEGIADGEMIGEDLDVQEAADRGILGEDEDFDQARRSDDLGIDFDEVEGASSADEIPKAPPEPAADAGTVKPNEDFEVDYPTPGDDEPKDRPTITGLKTREQAKNQYYKKQATQHAKSAKNLKAVGTGAQKAGGVTGKALKAQATMMKAGGAAMVGAVTGHPYYGWRVGKSMGSKSYTGGAKDWLIGPSRQGQGGAVTETHESPTTTAPATGDQSGSSTDQTETQDPYSSLDT